ncbi:unnamed protein product [Anisakis simplex]|uniref:CSTF_C domain-containing protein n=1 Tax=Anisakis simplex TaxID=6269 RepID=A0A0M3KIP4_ANISI|nr:unnamed protein product [Anisakis simplex]
MAQQQLRGVWMAYRDGENCGLQQAKTFEIIRGLTETERSSIFGQQQSIAQRAPSDQTAATPELIPMFIRTSSPELTDFKKWIATIRAQKSQLDARINALPPEARNALQQIESLRAKERQIIQSLNPLVANQLIGIL